MQKNKSYFDLALFLKVIFTCLQNGIKLTKRNMKDVSDSLQQRNKI
jgi:hypothetical protein